jgi:hypothetical protein
MSTLMWLLNQMFPTPDTHSEGGGYGGGGGGGI